MSIKFTAPENHSILKLTDIITFRGEAAKEIVKVELKADGHYKLGEATVSEGKWDIEYHFNTDGHRHITVHGFDSTNQELAQDNLEIVLVGEITNVIGIDVSNYKGHGINWQAVKGSDVSFAFAKATEGITYDDNCFDRNWEQMKAVGLIRGAYHFFHPADDGKKQAEHFLKVVGNLEHNDLPPVLDLELEEKGIDLNQRIERVRDWLEFVEHRTGRKSLIYTSQGFWTSYMDNTEEFTKYPLWIANYTSQPKPLVPANNWGENGWMFWQYTEKGHVEGVEGYVDKNRFAASFDKLLAFIKDSFIN
ncbi:MAG: hypothetical protein F6J86_41525 [Symploca sp. SIO1B1]|nr:hypothetical protein [Symploca sp. SIO1B1]